MPRRIGPAIAALLLLAGLEIDGRQAARPETQTATFDHRAPQGELLPTGVAITPSAADAAAAQGVRERENRR